MWGVFSALVLIGSLFAIVLGGHWAQLWNPQLSLAIVATFFLSILTPVTIIAIRHQVRLSRIKLIDLFAASFSLSAEPRVAPAPGVSASPSPESTLVSFEFVKGKYYVDLDLREGQQPRLSDVPRFPMMLHADWMLLLCAIPFMAFSAFGIFILFAPLVEIANPAGSIGRWLWPSMLTAGGAGLVEPQQIGAAKAMESNVLMVAALAFSGAYFYCLRLFLRAVSVFDLSPVTFLRAFAHMVLATILAVVLYRVTPNWQQLQDVVSSPAAPQGAAVATVSKPWLLTAFVLGFVPDVALQFAMRRGGLSFKQRDDVAEGHSRTIPLTILDGIDAFIAFRLEEANIYDVQNLATFNPIMLHIESPYGIYETIDWVSQAQLCTVVGSARFLMFKRYNIRTIFDLERAVLAKSAAPEIKLLVGAILLCDTEGGRDLRKDFGINPRPIGPAAKPNEEFNEAVIASLTLAGIEHMVRLIVDDLHVHRLRQIWQHIGKQLGQDSKRLPDTVLAAGEEETCQKKAA